ncbi:uncharacterized protein PgNI_02096 [Pyricularia grisea]|uniref:GxGYxYP putative glycoside hydrolase third N-terminal domain-containing protein n=1 Tax=Pyricularia grisea TaxID=148305 RepID=A0A6P8BLD9_PYRGI|nr:uncharacterized protein PgNI_02096 [Pyricularia grisea]TLD17509.1 hypothetical protein PgNI_02096 [Pyricularia grisea]
MTYPSTLRLPSAHLFKPFPWQELLVHVLEAKGLRKLANASEVTYEYFLAGLIGPNEQPLARDLAVASGGTLVTLEVPREGYNDALSTLNPGAAIFGYGADEFKFTYGASNVGAGIVGYDWPLNLATLSSGDHVPSNLCRRDSQWLTTASHSAWPLPLPTATI